MASLQGGRDIWQHVNQERVKHYNQLQVNEQIGSAHFDIRTGGTLGCSIENGHLVQAGLQSLRENPAAQVSTDTQITGLSHQSGYLQVEVQTAETAQSVECRLLIGADGNRSSVKSLSQISTHGFSHN